jgi:hypothetical protein
MARISDSNLKIITAACLVAVFVCCDESSNNRITQPIFNVNSITSDFIELPVSDNNDGYIKSLNKRLNERIKTLDLEKLLISGKGDSFITDNEIYIIDNNQILLFRVDFNGSLDTLSVKGSGPGEISSPVAIDVFNDQLYILDGVNGLIKLDLNLDTATVYSSQSILYSQNFIATTDFLYFLQKIDLHYVEESGMHNNILRRLHEQKGDGKDQRFGKGYFHNHVMGANFFNEGVLIDSPLDSSIIEFNHLLPVVKKYSYDGKLIWVKGFKNFQVLEIVSVPNAWMISDRFRTDGDSEFNAIETVHDYKQYVIFQLSKEKWPREKRPLVTYIMNKENSKIYKLDITSEIMSISDSHLLLFESGRKQLFRY